MNHRSAAALLLLLASLLAGCSKKSGDGGSQHPQKQKAEKSSGNESSDPDEQDKSSKGGAQPNDQVKISEEDQRRIGIETALVLVQRVQRTLNVASQVAMDEQHTSHVGTIADGRITAVNVLPGAEVRRGQLLAYLHSHAVHETVGALVQAYAAVTRQRGAVTFARQAQERYHHLYAIQAASLEESQRSDQEMQQVQQMLVDAEASVHMEREHLSELLQVAPESLTPNNLYDRELIPIRSPIDGAVITRNISVGQVVDTGFVAFDISDLSSVWVIAAVNQNDVPFIHRGAIAEVVTEEYRDRVFPGRVAMVGDLLDAQTRTVPIRLVLPNRGLELRPGMFVSAHIAEPATRDAIFVPESALQNINGMPVVFVTTDGAMFQARTVNLGTRSMGKAEIIDGLKPGDRIVVNGAFMVKSEMLKSTMGDG